MMGGYRNAFLNSTVQSNILSQANGIAANVVFFGTNATVNNTWFHLSDATSITNFANHLGSLARPFLGSATNIADGMLRSRQDLLNTSAFVSNRLIMDVSGDGEDNRSFVAAVRNQRDAAAAAGITVNGITIGGGSVLLDYYTNNVITNDGFAIGAADFNAFEAAVLEKIVRETSSDVVPEPASLAIFGIGACVAGFGAVRRRRSEKVQAATV